MSYALRDIQALTGGELQGDAESVISGVNELAAARHGELAFAEHPRYLPQVRQSAASAVIVQTSFPAVSGKNLLRVAHPRIAFVKVMKLFDRPRQEFEGVHASAVVSPSAQLEQNVSIGECAVIRPHARIGQGTVIESGVHVGSGVVIGQDCVIGPNVVLVSGTQIGHRVIIHSGSVLGGDGFGYVWADGRYVKVPQLGHVIIEDDVAIGSNVCVDRATLGSTIIRRGTKIDNLVQIAHNDSIGQHVIMSGQVGLSGSVTVGDRAMFGGKSGVVDHITIGHDARVGAASAVIKDVRPNEIVWGNPARPIRRMKREYASLGRLPELLGRWRQLQVQLEAAEARLARLEQAPRPSGPVRQADRVQRRPPARKVARVRSASSRRSR